MVERESPVSISSDRAVTPPARKNLAKENFARIRLPKSAFCRRRIDFRDPEKAIGLGIVRSGDERAAHFCAVPSGLDTKPKRLVDLDVARREILHGRSLSHRRSTIERCQGFGCWVITTFAQLSWNVAGIDVGSFSIMPCRSQDSRVALRLGQRPSDVGCFLRDLAAVPVEIEWLVIHWASRARGHAQTHSGDSSGPARL